MEKRRKLSVADMSVCGLFAALSAVLSQIVIPIGPVPVNLALLSVFLAGGLLGAKYGVVSQLVFVVLGAAGAPVFAGFTGGPGVIVGKTGGFIAGYIACVFLIGLAAERFGRSALVLVPAMTAGALVTYTLGTLWFMVVTHTPLAAALGYCVLPFLPGDAGKIALSAALVPMLYRMLQRPGGTV